MSETSRMTKEQYWGAHLKKNPKWADETARIELMVSTLKALMFEAYDRGLSHHKTVEKLVGKAVEKPFNDIFGDLFGGKSSKK